MIIRGLLAQVGIKNVIEAADGEEALAFLRSWDFEDPDVVICDLHMAKMDGMEFCNCVRRDKAIQKRLIPIIILTGDGDKFMHDVSRQIGATSVLTKPISAPDLLHEIETAIGFTVQN